jgi:hypothetical protein
MMSHARRVAIGPALTSDAQAPAGILVAHRSRIAAAFLAASNTGLLFIAPRLARIVRP